MQAWLGALTIGIMIGLVAVRVLLLKRRGVEALKFGETDRSDFLIPPFALFYFYLVFANAFHLPTPARQPLFHSEAAAWVGVGLCLAGLALLLWSLLSFGRSFRVGIDARKPNRLVTDGAFAFSRNPIYVAFFSILLGQFLVFPHWLLLLFLGGAAWLFHRQVLREEAFLRQHYGGEYDDYCRKVGRYM